MASSSPLIDAVSQEILAPMTGGAMPMANGGIAAVRKRLDRINKVNALIRDGVPAGRAMQLVDGGYFASGDIRPDGEEGGGRKWLCAILASCATMYIIFIIWYSIFLNKFL